MQVIMLANHHKTQSTAVADGNVINFALQIVINQNMEKLRDHHFLEGVEKVMLFMKTFP